MAVQKSKKTRSRVGMRRSHDRVSTPSLCADSTSSNLRRRHHIGRDGYYRGRLIIAPKVKSEIENQEETSEG